MTEPDVARVLAEAREKLAAYAHEAWSGWMRYLWGKSEHYRSGQVVIPAEWAERWTRQMATPYAELREDEKESDRKEADRMLEACGLVACVESLQQDVQHLLDTCVPVAELREAEAEVAALRQERAQWQDVCDTTTPGEAAEIVAALRQERDDLIAQLRSATGGSHE